MATEIVAWQRGGAGAILDAASLLLGKDAAMNLDPASVAMPYDPKVVIVIRYTNYRAETSVRRVVPIRIRFASSEWHPGEQWIMDAFDLDRQAERSFALADVQQWNVGPDGPPEVGQPAQNMRGVEDIL